MERSDAMTLRAYIRALTGETSVKPEDVPGVKAALLTLHGYAEGTIEGPHAFVACDDCETEFLYCDEANHFCPTCGESGEGAPDA